MNDSPPSTTPVIRPETPEDHQAVFAVLTEAFEQRSEGRLVNALRNSDHFIPELSLVAELEGSIIGHILFTRMQIRTEDGLVDALSLAPMAVARSRQKQGIGSQLVIRGLEECRRLGFNIVLVLGHAEYYPRFGFTPARARGIDCPWPDVPDESWLVLELIEGALRDIRGTAVYSPLFNE